MDKNLSRFHTKSLTLLGAFPKVIRKINEKGTTILLIEQNAKKTLQTASKGYVLQKGEIVVHGSRKGLYENDFFKKAYPRGEESILPNKVFFQLVDIFPA